MPNPGGTHWTDCWRAHHECARVRIERLEAEKRQLEVSHAALADAYARMQGGSLEVGGAAALDRWAAAVRGEGT